VGGSLSIGSPIPASGGAKINLGTGGLVGIITRPPADPAYALAFYNAADGLVGYIQSQASATLYATSSDGNLKEDLKSFDAGNIVDNTAVYDFAWRSTKERAFGVIAQEAKELYPAAFTQNGERWFVDYSKYVPILLQELQALRARVAQLEARSFF
jgi:hypothetical protein